MRALAVVALALAAPAFAQAQGQAAGQPVCIRAEVMPGFEAWGHGGSGGVLKLASMATLELAPAAGVRLDPPPARALVTGTFANQFPLTIAKAGTYSIALSSGAWIEVTRDGRRLESVSHGHGKDCSGIRKIVDFALRPGTYQVQLSESAAPSIAVLVVAKP